MSKYVASTKRTKAASVWGEKEALSSQRGAEWRAYSASAGAPIEAVYESTASRRPCVTHISGYSLSATVQTIRIRAGAGTTMFKTRLPLGTNSFEFTWDNPPLWGVEGLSIVCAITSSAGSSEQAIDATGYDEYVL